MTENEVLQSTAMRALFLHDTELPITIVDDPFFLQRLTILDPCFHSKSAFKTFCQECARLSDETTYLNWRSCIETKLRYELHHGEASKYVREFFGYDLGSLIGKADYLPCSPDPFPDREHADKTYIRVYLKDGVLTALHKLFPNILGSTFLPDSNLPSHLIRSVKFRECILNSIHPLRQIQLATVCTMAMADHLRKHIPNKLTHFSGNGAVFEVTMNDPIGLNELLKWIRSEPNGYGDMFDVEMFRIGALESLGFIKEHCGFDHSPPEFVGVDPNLIHQVVACYYHDYIMDDDLVINYDGRLAKLKEPIKNPFT